MSTSLRELGHYALKQASGSVSAFRVSGSGARNSHGPNIFESMSWVLEGSGLSFRN